MAAVMGTRLVPMAPDRRTEEVVMAAAWWFKFCCDSSVPVDVVT